MFILLCSPHSFELLTTSLILISFFFFFSRIVTEKPHQGSVNKLLYCIVLDLTRQPRPRVLSYSSPERTLGTRLKRKWTTVTLFPVVAVLVTGVKHVKILTPSYWNGLKKVSCRFLRFYSDTSIWIISTEKWTKPVKLIESL